jgi:hypothetical protein
MEALRDQWRRTTADVRSDSVLHRLVDHALTKPAFTISDAVFELGGTFASVNQAARRLVELGILIVAKGQRRNRLFQAPAVLDIFDPFRPGGRERADGPPV